VRLTPLLTLVLLYFRPFIRILIEDVDLQFDVRIGEARAVPHPRAHDALMRVAPKHIVTRVKIRPLIDLDDVI
jgi:hypothetical protein